MAKSLVGTVASDKADKTIVVAVTSRKTHPIYKKQYTITKRYAAHDANNDAKVGDRVSIVECRPVSASKRFTLLSVIERAGVAHTGEADTAVVEEVTHTAAKKTEETDV